MNVPVVDFRQVERTYPGATPVRALKPADLIIHKGEYVAITGRSGSGKSTLLHILGLLDRPSAGTFLLNGVDATALTDVERTAVRGKEIGFVFQGFHLLPHRTVLENVHLALVYNRTNRRVRWELAANALDRVGLGHRLDALPPTLSGGERQRVAIARAVVSGPALLLADEPTGNLDSTTAESVLDLFGDLHRAGLTVVVITHDPVVAGRTERQITISDGNVAEHIFDRAFQGHGRL